MIFGNALLFFVSLFLMGIMLLMICLEKNHLLSFLLLLEGIILGLYMIMILSFGSNSFLSLVFLSFIACEAALGLSVMVKFVRSHGNDYVNSISSGKF